MKPGATRTATTDTDGFYNVGYLQPGVYEITVQSAGFAEGTKRAQVTIGTITRLNKDLSVTPVTGTADIREPSGGVTVNAQNQQLSDFVSGRQIRELPTRAGCSTPISTTSRRAWASRLR